MDKKIDLVKEFQNQKISKNTIIANVSVMQTNDELFDTLLDLKV